MKRKIFLFFIFLSFSQVNFAAALEEDPLPKGTIRFFNVGQGNCTLITTEGRPPILIDAGTTHYKHLGKDRMGVVKPIVEAIKASYRSLDPASYENKWPLTISISHFDEDHHNLIPDILRAFLAGDTTDTPLDTRLVIGGDEDNIFGFADDRIVEEWQKSDQPLNTPAVKKWLAFGEVTTEGDGPSTSVISHILGEKDIGLSVPSGDANSRSLVLRAAIQNWSAVIPGDATNKTTKQVIANTETYSDMQADVLLASHHGAIEGCNDEDWIRRVAPKFVIVSAGTRRDYEHPRGDVIERFLNIGRENGRFRVVPPHDIYYYKESPLAEHRALDMVRGDGYLTIRGIMDPIYTTFTNGRIEFSSDASALPSCEIELYYGARGAAGGAGARGVGELESELMPSKMSGDVVSADGAGVMPGDKGSVLRNRDADELPAAPAAPVTPVRSTIGDASTALASGGAGAGEASTPPSAPLSPSLLERLGGLTLAGRDLVWDTTKAVSPRVAKVLWDGGAAVGTTVATYTPVVAGAIFNGGKAVSNIIVTHGPGVVSAVLEKGKSFGGVVATYTPVVTESVASGGAAVANGLKATLAVCARPRSTHVAPGSQTPQASSTSTSGIHRITGSDPGPIRTRADSRDERDELATRLALMRLFNAAASASAPAPAAASLLRVAAGPAPAPAAASASVATPPEGMQFVRGYTRSDGRQVEGYLRRTPKR